VSNQLSTVNFFTPVQDLLPKVEQRMHSQADGYHPDLGAALDHLLASGGKRIRPATVLLMGGLLNGDPDRLITLAAAVEMLHTATLVHDDLIDGSILRRGIATLNAKWSAAATVLSGDFIFARAAKLAAETNSIKVMRTFAETLTIIVNGEITQLFSKQSLSSRENYNQRIYAKTASLFETASGSAAVLSTSDEAIIEKARCYGYSIGMAFQVIDDILDFTADQSILGKPVASDLRQGLITLPAFYYLESHPGDAALEAIHRGESVNEEKLASLIDAIRQSGAIHMAMSDAENYVQQGIDALAGLPDNPQHQALEELAWYIVRRNL